MRFWDSSAIVPLVIREPSSDEVTRVADEDRHPIVWWSTPVEVEAALRRALRAGRVVDSGYRFAAKAMEVFHASGEEIAPGEEVRRQATRLLRVHELRAADALQLAAAMVWCGGRPDGEGFVSLDRRLRDAAELEGFTVLPAERPVVG